MIKNRRAFIVGLKSTKLSSNEISFLKKYKPWSVILFSRNIKSIKQIQKLTDKIKLVFKDKKVSPDKLVFLKAISNVIKTGMDIIGVDSPEKM